MTEGPRDSGTHRVTDNHLQIFLQHLTVPGPLGPVTKDGSGIGAELFPGPGLRSCRICWRLGGQGREDDPRLAGGDGQLVVQVLSGSGGVNSECNNDNGWWVVSSN